MPSSSRQSGNVLFYILLCIVLFAALGFAVSNMMRGGGNGNVGEIKTAAVAELLQYADEVKTAIRGMQIDGVDPSAFCFHDPGWGNNNYNGASCATAANKVFDPAGGAMIWERPPPVDNDGSPWLFTGANGVQGVGTTCASASCADLKMILPNVTRDLCIAINVQLGITNPGGMPPVDTGYDATPFTGSYAVTATADLGDEAGSSALAGKTEGCFQSATAPTVGTYHFYRVLLSR